MDAEVPPANNPILGSSTLTLFAFLGFMLLNFSLKKPFISGDKVGERLLPRLESTLRFLSTLFFALESLVPETEAGNEIFLVLPSLPGLLLLLPVATFSLFSASPASSDWRRSSWSGTEAGLGVCWPELP